MSDSAQSQPAPGDDGIKSLHSKRRPKLDVPSATAVVRRKEILVERMLKDSKRPVTTRQTSSVLGRVKAFLPHIQQANQNLLTMKKEDIEIETVDESDSYVEMNLCLVSEDESHSSEDEKNPPRSTESNKVKVQISNTAQKVEVIEKLSSSEV